MGFFDGALKTITGGLIGGLPGAALGAAGDLFGASQQQDYNVQNMNMQNAINQQNYKTRYQNTVSDMKAAGLNPVLAANWSLSPPSGVGLPSAPNLSNLGSSSVSSMSSAYGMAKTSQETKKASADTDKVRQEIENLKTTQRYTESQIAQISQLIAESKQRIGKLIAETMNIQYKNIDAAIVARFLSEHPNLVKAGAISEKIGIKASDVLRMFNIGIGALFGNVKKPGTWIVNKKTGEIIK